MEQQLVVIDQAATVARWRPGINDRHETHLDYSIWYVAANGRTRWIDGTLPWACFGKPEELRDEVLRYQTSFVKQQWIRIEVCIPNRDNYGNLQPGFIQDTGFLLVRREVAH